MHDQLAVHRGLEQRALLLQMFPKRIRIGQVPIVRNRQRPSFAIRHKRLRIGRHARARGRIPGMPNGEVSIQTAQDFIREHARHRAQSLVRPQLFPVSGHNARTLIPPVLQGIQAQIRQPCGLLVSVDSEYAACFSWFIVDHR